VQLLVARAAARERELLDAVAAEGRVRVAVDEAGIAQRPRPSTSSTSPSSGRSSRIAPTASIVAPSQST
jgi:hypothetical protein